MYEVKEKMQPADERKEHGQQDESERSMIRSDLGDRLKGKIRANYCHCS